MSHEDRPMNREDRPTTGPAERETLPGVLPTSSFWSAAAGVLFTVPLGLVATALAVYGFELYGAALFCMSPFSVGVGSALIFGYRKQRSLRMSIGVAQFSLLLLAICIFVFAIEGLICLLMAAPIAMVLAALGGAVGWVVAGKRLGPKATGTTLVVLVASLPMLMGFEDATFSKAPLAEVTTSVVADAPVDAVWAKLVDVDTLPEPDGGVFRTGIAYPTELRLDGEGPEARLAGDFSTGPFELSVDTWDAPHRLAFSVTRHPPAMREWSIYDEIDAPHVAGYFGCESGEIHLEELPGGRTRLTGTTRYRHDVRPASYWSIWSDAVIDRLHRRVLDDVARRAELDR